MVAVSFWKLPPQESFTFKPSVMYMNAQYIKAKVKVECTTVKYPVEVQ